MKRSDLAFSIGVLVTALTTWAAPGGLFESVVIGTGSGVLAVGVVQMLMHRR